MLRVGSLVILCVPGELTTMAGRRLKEAVIDQVDQEAVIAFGMCSCCALLCDTVLLLFHAS